MTTGSSAQDRVVPHLYVYEGPSRNGAPCKRCGGQAGHQNHEVDAFDPRTVEVIQRDLRWV